MNKGWRDPEPGDYKRPSRVASEKWNDVADEASSVFVLARRVASWLAIASLVIFVAVVYVENRVLSKTIQNVSGGTVKTFADLQQVSGKQVELETTLQSNAVALKELQQQIAAANAQIQNLTIVVRRLAEDAGVNASEIDGSVPKKQR